MQYLHQRNPRIKLILDYITHEGDIRFAADAGFFGVAAPGSDLSDEEVELARSLGLRIQLYGARLQQDIVRELDKRPDYFLADNILMTQRIRQAGSN